MVGNSAAQCPTWPQNCNFWWCVGPTLQDAVQPASVRGGQVVPAANYCPRGSCWTFSLTFSLRVCMVLHSCAALSSCACQAFWRTCCRGREGNIESEQIITHSLCTFQHSKIYIYICTGQKIVMHIPTSNVSNQASAIFHPRRKANGTEGNWLV